MIKKNENFCKCIVNILDNYKTLLDCDKVLIEKQPSKNNKMRITEGLLNAYYVIRGITNDESTIKDVIVYSAKHKLGVDTFKGKRNYSQRKKLGVFRCHAFLNQIKQSDEIQNIFSISKKKDDLADCLLQALSYFNFDINCNNEQYNQQEKVVARRPTKKQINTLYSKSNIKWLLQQSSAENYKDTIINDKKIINALTYWYPNIEYDDVIKKLT